VPVIATDTGGIREVILDSKAGYLVKPHDIKTLQERLEELLKKPSLRKEFTHFASLALESGGYTLDSLLKETTRIYSDLYSKGCRCLGT